ncbi:uncharacterized protein L203_102192 [Cryptococcus depauperatus CBS 7841]|uniref:Uncharacterized protein n=1 Tax=Cryptococcus depauperatus CBS 7841 TaxID=1295531 RepID=A0AAJ8M0W0_9TREE
MPTKQELIDQSSYGYIPTNWVCIIFIVLFSITGLLHILQAIRFKYWIAFPTLVVGCFLEVLGSIGRYWSSQNVLARTPFLMQICVASLFQRMVLYDSCPSHQCARPLLFFSFTKIGGGWVASSDAPIPPKTPTNIMVVGIIFQLVSMLIFCSLALDFMLRAWNNKPWPHRERALATSPVDTQDSPRSKEAALDDSATNPVATHQEVKGWWWVMTGVALCSLMIIIRGLYRSVELVQGWNGYLITHQVYQDTLDAVPMFLALVFINVFHPGFFLPKRSKW